MEVCKFSLWIAKNELHANATENKKKSMLKSKHYRFISLTRYVQCLTKAMSLGNLST